MKLLRPIAAWILLVSAFQAVLVLPLTPRRFAVARLAYAEDPVPDASKPSTEAANSDPDADAPPAPKRKKKYRRSKLTTDESEGTADHRHVLLNTGEDKTIDLDFIPAHDDKNGIVVGNPKILTRTLVTTAEDKRQLVLKPLGSGETTLTVRDESGKLRLVLNVRVTPSNLLRVAGEIRDLLRDVEGLDVRIVGPKVVLEGELLTPADYGRLVQVAGPGSDYAQYVLNLAILAPLAMQVLSKRIQDDVNTFAPNVRTRVVNGIIFIEGTVDTFDQAQRAGKIAALYLPEVRPGNPLDVQGSQKVQGPRQLVQNFLIINPPPPKKQEKLIRITVHFVELSKDFSKIFGFKWQPGFTSEPTIQIGQTAQGATAASGTSFSAIISNLFPKLQTAEAAGYARVLKTGTLIVRSSQEATLDESTEIPFLQLNQTGQTGAQSKQVGLHIVVKPVILGQSEDIQMDLKMKQQVAGRAISSQLPPQISNHEVDTNIYVKSNESAAVAGVTSSDVGTAFNADDPSDVGTDPNSATSPLFSLIRSKNYRKTRRQFVVFVTPQIIENASEGTDDLKKNFRIKVK